MNKKIFLLIGLFIAITFVITGCGKNVAEKAAENALESASNGDASVDIDDEQVTINTGNSSYQAGGDIDVPDGFPSDVYVVDGTITVALTYEVDTSYNIVISTNKSRDELKALYEEKMDEYGWTKDATVDTADIVTMAFKKGETRRANVTIAQDTASDAWMATITTQDTSESE